MFIYDDPQHVCMKVGRSILDKMGRGNNRRVGDFEGT